MPLDEEFAGISDAIVRLKRTLFELATIRAPVLLLGEPGSGKTLAARLLHRRSGRAGPFHELYCVGLSHDLVQAELFGHERGAFSGATTSRTGVFDVASGGAIFLDDIQTLPWPLQRAVLQVAERGVFRRLGGTRDLQTDIRMLASASVEPTEHATENSEVDFWQRAGGIVVTIPALRERHEDIPALAFEYVADLAGHLKRPIDLTADAAKALVNYDYPGNIRELRNLLERLALDAPDGRILHGDVVALITRLITTRAKSKDSSSTVYELERTRQELEYVKAGSIRATPIWEGRVFAVEPDYCFVLMPFADDADVQRVYQDHLKPILETRCGMRCERADDIYDVSGVMQSVWEGINRARLVIAELTGRNANVFYELGIAHTLGKSVVMLSQSIDAVPFDLRHLRCIHYSYKPSAIKRFEETLEKTVKRVLATTIAPQGLSG